MMLWGLYVIGGQLFEGACTHTDTSIMLNQYSPAWWKEATVYQSEHFLQCSEKWS